MAMRQFAARAATALRVRCGPAGYPFSVARSFSTVVEELKYAKSHEWVKIEGDIATIGITDHAQAELGDIVFAEVKTPVGEEITFDTPFAVVESVKAASDVLAPISGKVIEINAGLESAPTAVNESPYTDGWFAKVKLTNPSELDQLLDAKAYEAYVEAHSH